jgi:cyclopropane-fatty-acyl-phospholipid synthase
MVLETIFTHPPSYWAPNGIKVTMSDLRFWQFISREIFPAARCPQPKTSSNTHVRRAFDRANRTHEPALQADP